ncbi:RsmB/NOP family class I SAM-dependent RNA methyltransferase [Aestuariibius sp. 2305UL40-4]|uniref:RsmB/NOP family class I SAM-dependent RNA methyltransferase n=1 Tax=Aestuariibius violaceus TaxID=3234132 RepID=UPI00345E337F
MTPGGRAAAAIEVLDRILAGAAAEQALTTWGRNSRYAGSKDRAAVRDLVFSALRRRRSAAAMGGAEDGRGLILGLLRQNGQEPSGLFTGEGYAPDPLSVDEKAADWSALPPQVKADLPDWVYATFGRDLGDNADRVAAVLRERAPVHIRSNRRRISREAVAATLKQDGIEARPLVLSDTALEIGEGARRLRSTTLFADGQFELQDAASQALSDRVPLMPGGRFLDYCAGGGGKTLAIAARLDGDFFAHDANPQRLRDLPERAERAGIKVVILERPDGIYDTVLCDVPCSGSGAWRRSPEAKWRLTPDRLAELRRVQADILDKAARRVAPGGILAYATCSLFHDENDMQVDEFLVRNHRFSLVQAFRWAPSDEGDGFYLAILTGAQPGID